MKKMCHGLSCWSWSSDHLCTVSVVAQVLSEIVSKVSCCDVKHSRRSWARYVSVGVQTLADKSEQNGDLDPLSRSDIFVKRKKNLERLLFDTVVVAFSWHARILGEMLTNHLLFAYCCFLFCFFK